MELTEANIAAYTLRRILHHLRRRTDLGAIAARNIVHKALIEVIQTEEQYEKRIAG